MSAVTRDALIEAAAKVLLPDAHCEACARESAADVVDELLAKLAQRIDEQAADYPAPARGRKLDTLGVAALHRGYGLRDAAALLRSLAGPS